MSVTGYLALYTTLLGWQQYNNLWQIAVGTGLIYLPFIGIVLKSAIGPFTSMGAKDAAQIAVRRLVLNVISALFVIVFAAVPTVLLDPKVLHYDPLCTESTKSATPGDTGTTYDNAFPVPTGVKVPILWYFIMAFSNGITHAANVGLPCSPINYRALHSELDTSSIQDPALKQEIVQFYNDCYVPAYSTYLSGQANNEKQAQIDNSLEKHGAEDIGWLGSQTLLQINGFYDARSATAPVKGFPFDLARDIEE
ncbi:MAG TPA: conjugal transfer protein TraG N-terminal domain-containing protein, partial [Gammaproteobacteria bacterium]|nr:conjugal transfer protein TraG N-terminal domain-containing protein [Gammaproteobacteria bacterium]